MIGHLGKDPEVRTVGDSKVANFSLATKKKWKNKSGEKQEETQWHNIVAWSPFAELCEQYISKGTHLCVEGELTHRKYDDKEGVTRYVTEVRMTGMEFLGKAGDGKKSEPANTDAYPAGTDSDLPF